jgi:hypothetical protein
LLELLVEAELEELAVEPELEELVVGPELEELVVGPEPEELVVEPEELVEPELEATVETPRPPPVPAPLPVVFAGVSTAPPAPKLAPGGSGCGLNTQLAANRAPASKRRRCIVSSSLSG